MLNTVLPNTLFTGQEFQYLPTCHSTNRVAMEILSSGAASNGMVVITANQTAGQGQYGNSWEAEPGANLTFSVIYRFLNLPVSDQFYLTIVTSLAVYQTLTTYLTKKVNIKWPNDLYCNDRKICGILIQSIIKGKIIDGVVVGIGLNVNQTDFMTPGAISMKQASGESIDLEMLLKALLENLEVFFVDLQSGKKETLKDLYLQKLYFLNEKRRFFSEIRGEFEGIIRGVDQSGCLEVERGGSTDFYNLKEIKFLDIK